MDTSQNLKNFILGGDFNLPHINWQITTVNSNTQYGKAFEWKANWNLKQQRHEPMINEATRGQNTLVLLMTTNPGHF